MRLIDADALIQQYKGPILTYRDDYAEGVRDVIADIKSAPTIEAEPIKRGKWVKNEEESANHSEPIYRCSACLNWEAWGNYECTPFCPYCGAKMEVENG